MSRSALAIAGAALLGAAAFLYYMRARAARADAVESAPVEDVGLFGQYASALDWVQSWGEPAADVLADPAPVEVGANDEWAGYMSETKANANRAAFLAMIRTAEGTAGANGYRKMVGGSLFDSFADHPRKVLSGKFANGTPWRSSAAGAYQILAGTWDECKAALKLPDFSPASQDQAAVFLIRRRGALADVEAGRFARAVEKCRKEWASLPGAGYGQPEKSLAALTVAYERAGGTVA